MKDAPDKLKVSVNVADADWQKMQDLFDQEHKWMLGKMQENIRQVNAMFVEERRKVHKRYKEYDGCYLGHYVRMSYAEAKPEPLSVYRAQRYGEDIQHHSPECSLRPGTLAEK